MSKIYPHPRSREPRDHPSTPAGAPLPVVVVGGGPVGLATALGLARRGVEVTVLEADLSASFGSRAICLSRHSLEMLDRLGVGAGVDQVALPWTGGHNFYRSREVLSFQMPHGARDVRPPMVKDIAQSEVEEVLADLTRSQPVRRDPVGIPGHRPDTGTTTTTSSRSRPRSGHASCDHPGRRHRRCPQPGPGGTGIADGGDQLRGSLRHRRHPLALGPADRTTRLVRPGEQPGVDDHHASTTPGRPAHRTPSCRRARTPSRRSGRTAYGLASARHLAWLGNDLTWTLECRGLSASPRPLAE